MIFHFNASGLMRSQIAGERHVALYLNYFCEPRRHPRYVLGFTLSFLPRHDRDQRTLKCCAFCIDLGTVPARVNQFQAAAVAIGPAAPVPAGAVSHFVHHDVEIIGCHLARSVGAESCVRHCQREPLAGAGQFAAKIARRVRRVELRIIREQISRIAPDHQIFSRTQRLIRRKRPTDAPADFPAVEWQLIAGENPVLHTAKKPEPEIAERVEVPDYAHRLPEPLRKFTRGIVDEDHLSFIQGGGHGGSHPHLVNAFVSALIEDHHPFPNVEQSANWTCVGICAHQSALKGGDCYVPDFSKR